VGELLQFPRSDNSLLQKALRDLLAADGSVDQRVEDSPVSPSEWRKLARAAARDLERPVQTLEFRGLLHASLRDWPANAVEEAVHQTAMRRAMNALKLGPTSPGTGSQ
jgi:hypothetical protein